jgi:hypothetical protein
MKNLKIILAVLLLTSSTLIANAQQFSNSKIKFGVKGGVNFNNINASNTKDNKVLIGFNLGVFVKLPITDSFAIQPEFFFTTKGSEHNYQNTFVDGTAKYELNYIEIPVMMVFNLTNNFNFHLGPYASYLVSSNVKNVQDINFNFENNIQSGDFNKFDTGIAAGLGFDGENLGFGVRYNLGLVTVGKEKTYFGTNYVFPDGKNGTINLYLTYSIL